MKATHDDKPKKKEKKATPEDLRKDFKWKVLRIEQKLTEIVRGISFDTQKHVFPTMINMINSRPIQTCFNITHEQTGVNNQNEVKIFCHVLISCGVKVDKVRPLAPYLIKKLGLLFLEEFLLSGLLGDVSRVHQSFHVR